MANLLPLSETQLCMIVGRLPLAGPDSPATCVAEVGSWRPAAHDAGSDGPAARPPKERVTFERRVVSVAAPDGQGAPAAVHVWRYVGPVQRNGRVDLAGAIRGFLGPRCLDVAVADGDDGGHPTVTLDVANAEVRSADGLARC